MRRLRSADGVADLFKMLIFGAGPMDRWPYGPINIIAGLAGGFGYILYASFTGGPTNPNRGILIFASLETVCLSLANGFAFWRNLSLRRAEERFRSYWADRQAQPQKRSTAALD
jgi:hypothetical protein